MTYFLQILGSSSLAVVIFAGLLKYLGPKWIDHKFQEKLEEFKRKQEEELERYRFEISKMFNRASKVHEKEYTILPEIWDKLQRANGAVNQALSQFSEAPDFSRLTPEEIEAVISSMNISEIQKGRLRKSDDRFKTYNGIQKWKAIGYAEEEFNNLRNYYYLNKIFLDTPLQTELESAIEIVLRAYVHSKVLQQAIEAGSTLRDDSQQDIKPIIAKIEKMIQTRLRFEEA